MLKFFEKEVEYRFVFKENALKNIMNAKGWDTYAQMGQELGYTRQYISMLDKPNAEITHQFMISIAIALGSLNKGWWVHFRIVEKGAKTSNNHQRFNYDKYNRKRPYRPHSPSAFMREKDYEIETEGI